MHIPSGALEVFFVGGIMSRIQEPSPFFTRFSARAASTNLLSALVAELTAA